MKTLGFISGAAPFVRGCVCFVLWKVLFIKIQFPVYVWKNVFIRNKHNISFGKGVVISHNAFISPVSLVVGNRAWIGVNCFLCGKVSIGNDVIIGPNVSIPGASHDISDADSVIADGKLILKGTIIEDNVWIGANSVILDGVSIGEGAVIGAGSVVTGDVTPYSIVMGSPAKMTRLRK